MLAGSKFTSFTEIGQRNRKKREMTNAMPIIPPVTAMTFPPRINFSRISACSAGKATAGWNSLTGSVDSLSNLDLEFFASTQRQRKTRQKLGDLFQIGQTDQLDRRMHVAVRQ